MKILKTPVFFVLFFVIQGCNTLHQVQFVDLEIVEPGTVKIPGKFKNVAVRYNNANVAYNPHFSEYYLKKEILKDDKNTDSIASLTYYNELVENLKKHAFFDTVVDLEKKDFSTTKIILPKELLNKSLPDTSINVSKMISKTATGALANLIRLYPVDSASRQKTKILDPDFGLYSENELQQIAEETNAELFLSLDYFASLDGIHQLPLMQKEIETVYVIVHWNFYDLQTRQLKYYYNRIDTVFWERSTAPYYKSAPRLPERNHAVVTAASIQGTRFAEYLVPHWIPVQRIFYKSGQYEIKITKKLIEEGKWKEAAQIWKAHVTNPNKRIAAKCMFNMGLACEIEGDIDAALDWVVRSYHALERKYEAHNYNCTEYIKILSQRKLDIKLLEKQFE